MAALGSFLGVALPEGGMVAALGSCLGVALPEGGMVAALGSFLGVAPVTNCGICKFMVLSMCFWEAPRVTSCSVSVEALCMGAMVSEPKSAAIFAKPSLNSGLIESSELEGTDKIDASSVLVAALMLLLGARVWSSSGVAAIVVIS